MDKTENCRKEIRPVKVYRTKTSPHAEKAGQMIRSVKVAGAAKADAVLQAVRKNPSVLSEKPADDGKPAKRAAAGTGKTDSGKKFKRVLLKLSGEALAGEEGGYNEEIIADIAGQVKKIRKNGTDVGIVIGGGNIWRGKSNLQIDRTKSDSIGMMATIMNCIYVSEHFRAAGLKTAIFTPWPVSTFTEVFSKDLANEYFAEGRVVFFAGGTGHPYFSTDTGVVLRAMQMEADLILAAKNVDGVYDKDPVKNPDAKKWDRISIHEVVERRLGVIDLTASALLDEHQIPMRVFALKEKNSIVNALGTKFSGTDVVVDK